MAEEEAGRCFRGVHAFLQREGLSWRDLDGQHLLDSYMAEADEALRRRAAGQSGRSSLEMLPTYIDSHLPLPASGQAVVVDAGGSNLRAGLVSFKAGEPPSLTQMRQSIMPGSDGYVSYDDFFARIAGQVGSLVRGDLPLGFCFSYSFNSQPNLDGRLNHWSKEIQAPDIPGSLMGEGLLQALARGGYPRPQRVVLLNDSSATLLTGLAFRPERRYSDAIGYILGTGINLAYSEPVAGLSFIPSASGHESMVFNTESGNFAKVPQGSADRRLDQSSADPGCYRLEKMCSGRYFGEVVRQTLLLAGEQGLICLRLCRALEEGAYAQPYSLSSKVVNSYLYNPWQREGLSLYLAKDTEYEFVYHLIDALLQRTALVGAAVAAAAVLRSRAGNSPLHPLALVIDGTSYYQYHQFSDRFYLCLGQLLGLLGEDRRYLERISVNNAPIIGAAVAALTQREWQGPVV